MIALLAFLPIFAGTDPLENLKQPLLGLPLTINRDELLEVIEHPVSIVGPPDRFFFYTDANWTVRTFSDLLERERCWFLPPLNGLPPFYSAASGPPLYLHFISSGTSPVEIASIKVCVPGDFDAAGGELKGHIDARGNKFWLRVAGRYNSTTNFFREEVDLDQLIEAKSYFVSSIGWGGCLVLSSDADCSRFLEREEALCKESSPSAIR